MTLQPFVDLIPDKAMRNAEECASELALSIAIDTIIRPVAIMTRNRIPGAPCGPCSYRTELW